MSISKTQFSTPTSSRPASPSSVLEEWIIDAEDLQDIDAISIASSVSTTSQKVLDSIFSSLTYSKNKLLQLSVPQNPLNFDFTFPSLEEVFPS